MKPLLKSVDLAQGKASFALGLILFLSANLPVIGAGPSVPAGSIVGWGRDFDVPALTNVVGIAAGWDHGLALLADGSVVSWGVGSDGTVPVPSDLTNAAGLAAGRQSMALKEDGTIVTWGNPTAAVNERKPSGLSNVVAISESIYIGMVLKADGTAVAWGSVWDSPQSISGVKGISAGVTHYLALKEDGTVVTDGDLAPPVPPGLSNVIAVAAGQRFSMALKDDGTVIAWNSWGLLLSPPPTNIVAISAGVEHALGLRADGTVVAWFNANVPPGLSGVVAISAGYNHSLAITTNIGTLIVPPKILEQPPDTNVAVGATVAFNISAGGSEPLTYQWLKDGTVLIGATNAVLVVTNVQLSDAGSYSIVASNAVGTATSLPANLIVSLPPNFIAQPQDQSAYSRGTFFFSAAADGTGPLSYQWYKDGVPIPAVNSPFIAFNNAQPDSAGTYHLVVRNVGGSVTSAPAVLTFLGARPAGTVVSLGGPAVPPGLTSVVAVAAGYYHGLALKSDGTVSAWGNNLRYACDVPSGLTDVVAIAAGWDASLALRSDGTIASWGIGQAAHVPFGLAGVIAISAGFSHGLALLNDGTLVGWGSMFGQNNLLTNVVDIDAGSDSSMCVRADGSVVIWGLAEQHAVVSGVSNAVAVTAGHNSRLVLLADGSVVAPVRGPFPYSQPYAMATGQTGLVAIATGRNYGLGLSSNGTVTSLVGSNTSPALNDVAAVSVSEGFGLLITTNAPRPLLSATAASANIEFNFPVSVSGYILEATTSPVHPYSEVTAYTNSFISDDPSGRPFAVPLEGSARFFRLRKP